MSVSRKGTQKKDSSEKEVKVAEWADTQVKNEMARLKDLGQSCLPVKVKNTAIVKENDVYVNRVECDTAFDFDRVEQILISDPISCPIKPGYNYVHVILLCKNIPLILPYFYSDAYIQKGLNLCEWNFINNKLKSTRLNVEQFSEA